MLQESILSEARIVSAFSAVLLLQGVRAISARINLTGEQIAHVHTQELCPRACLGQRGSLARQLNAELSPLPGRRSIVIRMITAS